MPTVFDMRAVTAGRLSFPAILRFGLGEPEPPPVPVAEVIVHRQPLSVASDWQASLCDIWRSHDGLSPAVLREIEAAGLRDRCGFFANSDPSDPQLRIRMLAEPTVRYFGRGWAESQLGRPHLDDPHADYAARIDREYQEAIDGGEPLLNLITMLRPGQPPTVYTHVLLGWTAGAGRRAVLSGVEF